jgi:carbonyl reductase 1
VQAAGAGSEKRIECVSLDVTDAASVQSCSAALLSAHGSGSFYGLVNNAGVGFGRSLADTLATNLYGPKSVTEAMLPLLARPGGRIVNVASASGPMFVAKLSAERRSVFLDPATTWAQLQERVDEALGSGGGDGDAYGFSKACCNMYSLQVAQQQPDLVVNSCTPGFINTQLTQGMGATGTPEQGTRCPLHCLFAAEEEVGSGRYYGSDSVRSPLDRYRGPGDPPYSP